MGFHNYNIINYFKMDDKKRRNEDRRLKLDVI